MSDGRFVNHGCKTEMGVDVQHLPHILPRNPPPFHGDRTLPQHRGAQNPCKVGIPVPGPLLATKSPSVRGYIANQRDKDVHEPDNSTMTSDDTRDYDWNKRLQQPRYECEYVQGKWTRTPITSSGLNDPKQAIRIPVPYADPIAISLSAHYHMVYAETLVLTKYHLFAVEIGETR